MSEKRTDIFLEKYRIPRKSRMETEAKQLEKVDWAALKEKVQKRYDEGKAAAFRKQEQEEKCKKIIAKKKEDAKKKELQERQMRREQESRERRQKGKQYEKEALERQAKEILEEDELLQIDETIDLPEYDEDELLGHRSNIQQQIAEIDAKLQKLTTTEEAAAPSSCEQVEKNIVTPQPQVSLVIKHKKRAKVPRCWNCGVRGHEGSECFETTRKNARKLKKEKDNAMIFNLIPAPPAIPDLPEVSAQYVEEVFEELQSEDRPSWAEMMGI